MQLSREKLAHFVSKMPEKIDVVELFDKILLMAKIEQASEVSASSPFAPGEIENEVDLWG